MVITLIATKLEYTPMQIITLICAPHFHFDQSAKKTILKKKTIFIALQQPKLSNSMQTFRANIIFHVIYAVVGQQETSGSLQADGSLRALCKPKACMRM